MSYPVIKASEIAEYTYCSHAWWLRVETGQLPASKEFLAEGSAYHSRHGRRVAGAHMGRRIALVLLFLAVSIFVFWLIRAT